MVQALLGMIERVMAASSYRLAVHDMLKFLLRNFDMDQAAMCERQEGEFKVLYALDSTFRILSEQEVWLSQKLMDDCWRQQKPVHLFEDNQGASINSQSLSEWNVKNGLCCPVGKGERARVVFLVSRKNPLRTYSEQELHQLQVAAEAAGLALKQQESVSQLEQQNQQLNHLLKQRHTELLFCSPQMERVVIEAHKFAPFNLSLLLGGESGVGKEELAREIHRQSGRSGQFVAVNCANLTDTLLESELFGYQKGAFTGAYQNKKGLFQEAEGGTIFLDEIGELPLSIQPKLLRVIQEREARPLGASTGCEINVRFISASHQNLAELVAQKKFRDDLFYRINEYFLYLPPLRERTEDIELLANHFIQQFCLEFKLSTKKLDPCAVEKLQQHAWPGNVRELRSVCRTAVILSKGAVIVPADIRMLERAGAGVATVGEAAGTGVIGANGALSSGFDPVDSSAIETTDLLPVDNLKDLSKEFERKTVLTLLGQKGETQQSVAAKLNISVRTLQRIIER